MRIPYLNGNVETLHNLYLSKTAVTAKDIQLRFKVSQATAHRVVDYAQEFAKNKGYEIYITGRKIVPIEVLFEMYGWNAKTIVNRAKHR